GGVGGGDRAGRCGLTRNRGEAAVEELTVTPLRGEAPLPERRHFDLRFARVREEAQAFTAQASRYDSDNRILTTALERSLSDIGALRLEVEGRTIVGAGIPWFAAPFRP